LQEALLAFAIFSLLSATWNHRRRGTLKSLITEQASHLAAVTPAAAPGPESRPGVRPLGPRGNMGANVAILPIIYI
jgi:hypothetical protein